MSTATINIDANLARFNSALAAYIAAHAGRKAVNEIVEAKGRDIGIRLFSAFSIRKWGGAGKKRRDLAASELAVRSAQGRGIKVRRSIMEDYLAARGSLRGKQAGRTLTGRMIEARARLWQKFVGRELAARQRGIGVLAAAFLWYRRRGKGENVHYVRNRSGKYSLGYVQKSEDLFRIVADVNGIGEVDIRYGIVNRVLGEATADIEQYFRERPEYWQFWNTFNAGAAK